MQYLLSFSVKLGDVLEGKFRISTQVKNEILCDSITYLSVFE